MTGTRWVSFATWLETALENRAYRLVLTLITVVFVVVYVGAAVRVAQPSKWTESRLIQIDDSLNEDPRIGVREVDTINRSIHRLEQLQSVLAIRTHRLIIRPTIQQIETPFALETHVLRLWIDELREFSSRGVFDVVPDSVVRAIIAVVFPDSREGMKLPKVSTNWHANVRSIRETCDEEAAPSGSMAKLCGILAKSNLRKSENPNPFSLSPWLTSQMVSEADLMSTGKRVAYMRELVRAVQDAKLNDLDSAREWPEHARDYGGIVRDIVTRVAPSMAKLANFKIGLLVVTSCEAPKLGAIVASLENVDVRDVVWAQSCENSLSGLANLQRAESAQEFAEKNPDAVFAQIGLREVRMALDKGWIQPNVTVEQFMNRVSRAKKSAGARLVSYLVPQREDWDSKAQATRVHAPVEILKLVRLRPI